MYRYEEEHGNPRIVRITFLVREGVGVSNLFLQDLDAGVVKACADCSRLFTLHGPPLAGEGIMPLASRTKDGLLNLLDKLKKLPEGYTGLARPLTRLAKTLYGNVATHPYRGAILPSGDTCWKQAVRASPIWFAFSGTASLLQSTCIATHAQGWLNPDIKRNLWLNLMSVVVSLQ